MQVFLCVQWNHAHLFTTCTLDSCTTLRPSNSILHYNTPGAWNITWAVHEAGRPCSSAAGTRCCNNYYIVRLRRISRNPRRGGASSSRGFSSCSVLGGGHQERGLLNIGVLTSSLAQCFHRESWEISSTPARKVCLEQRH